MLQIAANPYVTILGPERTASSRLNLSQGFNSFGTTIGPIIGGFLIFTILHPHRRPWRGLGQDALPVVLSPFSLPCWRCSSVRPRAAYHEEQDRRAAPAPSNTRTPCWA